MPHRPTLRRDRRACVKPLTRVIRPWHGARHSGGQLWCQLFAAAGLHPWERLVHALTGRLFTPAIDALQLRVEHVLYEGYFLYVAHRHSGDPWDQCPTDRYGPMTKDELMHTLEASVSALIGWPD